MNWGLILRGLKHSSMRSKIFAVFGILLAYRALSHIPVPLAEPEALKQVIDNLQQEVNLPQTIEVLNLLSGGALTSLSIMLVGLGPYINASIIMQVLTKAVPKFEAMSKEGEFGRKKISQYTRVLSLPFALIQSVLIIFFLRATGNQITGLGDITASATMVDWILMVGALTTGAMILMWLGELITEKHVGNGISLLITVGIISQLPVMIKGMWKAVQVDDKSGIAEVANEVSQILFWTVNTKHLIIALIIIVASILMTLAVVYLNEAHRLIRISYAKKVKGNRTYSDVTTHIPLKLIAAGVIPIIFAIAFLSIPQLVGDILTKNWEVGSGWYTLGNNLSLWFSQTGTNRDQYGSWVVYIYPLSYFLLVILFTYFYTSIVFSAKDISEQLQRQGGFIDGVRPGKDTQKYLTRKVNRLNFFGSISLGLLAVSPIIPILILGHNFQYVFPGSSSLLGSSILILVAVALETLRQVESQALMATYGDDDQEVVTQLKTTKDDKSDKKVAKDKPKEKPVAKPKKPSKTKKSASKSASKTTPKKKTDKKPKG